MDFERIAMECCSKEFQDASKRFHETIPKYETKILVIEKIKNDLLLERYNR